MKNLFFGALLVAALGFTLSAEAQTWTSTGCMDQSGCSVGLAVDSGNTSKSCGGTWSACNCAGIANGCPVTLRSSCRSGESDYGPTVTGSRCCVNQSLCRKASDQEVSLEVNATQEDSLENVFGQMGRSTAYFGVVNQYNRSPNAGRSNTANARLDACLGYSNVDSFSDYLSCETACGDTSKNGYCQNSGGAVCIDRCKCKYPGNGTCNGY